MPQFIATQVLKTYRQRSSGKSTETGSDFTSKACSGNVRFSRAETNLSIKLDCSLRLILRREKILNQVFLDSI